MKILSVFTSLLFGCSTHWTYPPQSATARPPIRVCVEAPDTASELTSAVLAWDRAVGNWRHVQTSHGLCDVVVQEGQCESPTALACADTQGGRSISLVPGKYELDRTGILLHELGHILGAQHLGNTLMSATHVKAYTCPDMYTVLQVAAYQHANLNYFSWCE